MLIRKKKEQKKQEGECVRPNFQDVFWTPGIRVRAVCASSCRERLFRVKASDVLSWAGVFSLGVCSLGLCSLRVCSLGVDMRTENQEKKMTNLGWDFFSKSSDFVRKS